MSAQFTPVDQVEWKAVKYLKTHSEGPEEAHPWEYELVLPRPLADWDVFSVWERERTHSMRDNLKRGDILFDIGTEQGWLNLVYAQFVGPENMVLIEPTQEFWPNIMHTWYKNFRETPKAFYDGLLSDKTTDTRDTNLHQWPAASEEDLIDRNKYEYIHANSGVPEMTLDDFVKRSGIVPDALTMDTEGAEILILRGAEQTLRDHKPLVWASLHEDLALKDGYGDISNVYEFMRSLGYVDEHLATDHEIHTAFWHPEGRHIV